MNDFKLGAGWCATAFMSVAGVAIVAFGAVRAGGYVLAGAMVVGAAARLLMPADRDTGLRIRRKFVDAAFFLALAIALVVVFSKVKLS